MAISRRNRKSRKSMKTRKNRARRVYRAKKSNSYAGAIRIKRLGQLIRIGNDPSTSGGNPVVTASGNGSISLGVSSPDTMLTRQIGGAMVFKLSSATDFGDFANLFDRYKITGVKLQFLYQCNISNNDSTSGTNALPLISYSFDGDDATIPSSLDEVQKKQYCHQKILNGNYMFSVYLKPRILKEVYNSALTTGYNSAKATWLDSAVPDTPHYGLKMWLNNWGSGNTKFQQLTITPTYYLALKDTQ